MTGEEEAVPRVLGDITALTDTSPDVGGVLWKLTESGRQLDANVVRLSPGRHVAPHAEPDLDVLLLVVSGDGFVAAGPDGEKQPLSTGALLWLPHGSTRGLTAGDDGLAYLTVHRRRPGMRIGRAR
ncbi:cupin domain-containing protein [Streptomyces gilvus]|uniref:cupin domain-containing protein n=1 Tax=Streptomyces gilvus TaxID=2920937 RepID=UPI001F0E22AD|nr:cupin domain-containing protein [Streptomyces sp. CME 23]MCH5671025.1 cupin domain-containing protein [Streptomyces sp. CME 23]